MARLHVIYDPGATVVVPANEMTERFGIKVAVIDLPAECTPKALEKLSAELALKLLAHFHNPDV